MPTVVKASQRDHNLDGIVDTRQYFTRMQRRMKRYKIIDKNNMDWKKDAGKYVHRIWEWVDSKSKRVPVSCFSVEACYSDTNVKLFSRTCIFMS